jgi:hypothetical protein
MNHEKEDEIPATDNEESLAQLTTRSKYPVIKILGQILV